MDNIHEDLNRVKEKPFIGLPLLHLGVFNPCTLDTSILLSLLPIICLSRFQSILPRAALSIHVASTLLVTKPCAHLPVLERFAERAYMWRLLRHAGRCRLRCRLLCCGLATYQLDSSPVRNADQLANVRPLLWHYEVFCEHVCRYASGYTIEQAHFSS